METYDKTKAEKILEVQALIDGGMEVYKACIKAGLGLTQWYSSHRKALLEARLDAAEKVVEASRIHARQPILIAECACALCVAIDNYDRIKHSRHNAKHSTPNHKIQTPGH